MFVVAATGFIQCKLNSPKFDECHKDALQKAIPHLANGKNNNKTFISSSKLHKVQRFTFTQRFVFRFVCIYRNSQVGYSQNRSTSNLIITNTARQWII